MVTSVTLESSPWFSRVSSSLWFRTVSCFADICTTSSPEREISGETCLKRDLSGWQVWWVWHSNKLYKLVGDFFSLVTHISVSTGIAHFISSLGQKQALEHNAHTSILLPWERKTARNVSATNIIHLSAPVGQRCGCLTSQKIHLQLHSLVNLSIYKSDRLYYCKAGRHLFQIFDATSCGIDAHLIFKADGRTLKRQTH